jgi:hypothetical protein
MAMEALMTSSMILDIPRCVQDESHNQEAATKFGCMVLPHPPYSPNLTPSDHHFFGALKNAVSDAD